MQRPTAQGGTDLLMGLGAALAGAMGGPLMALGGYGLVATVSGALVVPLAVVWVHSGRRRPGQPVAPADRAGAESRRPAG